MDTSSLMEQILSKDNLNAAYLQVVRNKGAAGVDGMTVEEAKNAGAMGLFESKYGEKVKVYTMGDVSKEICGGPHAQHTGELGGFKILKEESSSRGVRRIKAVLDAK